MHFSTTLPLPMWHKEDYLMCCRLLKHEVYCAFKLWEEILVLPLLWKLYLKRRHLRNQRISSMHFHMHLMEAKNL